MEAAMALRPAVRMVRVREPVPSDGELIERIADGDRPAFEELYRRYARPVLGLALRRLGDRGRAEDAGADSRAAGRPGRRTGSVRARGVRLDCVARPSRARGAAAARTARDRARVLA